MSSAAPCPWTIHALDLPDDDRAIKRLSRMTDVLAAVVGEEMRYPPLIFTRHLHGRRCIPAGSAIIRNLSNTRAVCRPAMQSTR